jgi:hypothetical protein
MVVVEDGYVVMKTGVRERSSRAPLRRGREAAHGVDDRARVVGRRIAGAGDVLVAPDEAAVEIGSGAASGSSSRKTKSLRMGSKGPAATPGLSL